MIKLPLLHATEGPLTRELLRSPGDFGLGQVPHQMKPDAITQSICGFCATGCCLDIHMKEGAAVNLTPTTNYPVNRGMACPKGWEALTVLKSNERATTPLLKNKKGEQKPIDWETALSTFTQRFKAIQETHGEESVAFLSTGQIPTEEMALLGSLAKFGMGMRHGDGNTRQCMASAAVAYKQSFGFDAPPYTYQDFEESDVIFLVGSNLCIAHPILWERVMNNQHSPEIIVVDPRCTETTMQATEHLAIQPKSDLVLFYGIARILIKKNWIDRPFIDTHTNDFEEFANHVQQYSLEYVEQQTGIASDKLQQIAKIIHEGKRVSFWWTMGVNQSYQGVRTAQSLINLALMTGNIGRPGTGANSITGQCNAMGSRLFSNTTNLLGGHDFTNKQDRNKVAKILNINPQKIPDSNSWAYDEIVEGILSGKIKGLWVIATNPAHSWINQNKIKDILDRLDFLVVQDMYHTTETAQLADLLLPAAGWGEKEGTFINSERRISCIKKVTKAPGKALADFAIFKLIAHYWGCAEMFQEWESPAAVFQILKKLSKGQPCDITGILDYQMLDEQQGIQWSFSEKSLHDENQQEENQSIEKERRLFADGKFYHADERAKFLFAEPRPMPEPPNKQYPFILLTGRGTASQWHTQTRTKQSAVLRKLSSLTNHVAINPADAQQFNIQPNEWVIVESQRGRVEAKAFVTPTIQAGQLFIPMHNATTNRLTDSVFDPHSRQPSYKACAVRVRKKT
ncbi:Assimilatory nitrate reductase large subunit [hydrothermal vent metagenome]|uniref:Assimilatory nitrate reductase large subunit n=1 Tax=hydrothermal vent metagenome TaxID=652676 RepID=A0A3B1DLH6_9ZZZZ